MIQPPYQVRYQMRTWYVYFYTVALIIVAIGLGHTAMGNHKELNIRNVIQLSVETATILYWVVSVVCGLGAIFIVGRSINDQSNPRYLTFAPNEMRLGGKVIPYAAIASLRETKYRGRPIVLAVVGSNKVVVSINRKHLPNDKTYEEVKQFLASRLSARGKTTSPRT